MNNYSTNFDIIVVGGGHAGIEAALAAARLGKKTALFTINLDNIGLMPCNPSIGGPGKSHLVAELDILGGEMGAHTDTYNLQLKHLNTSKGPAARVTRAQADKFLYHTRMKEKLENTKNLAIIQETIDDLYFRDDRLAGVISSLDNHYYAPCVVLATGTFLKGEVVIGEERFSAGRQGEPAALHLSDNLKEYGLDIKRYQTATPPRVHRDSIDFTNLQEIHGEEYPNFFSLFTEKKKNNTVPTWLTTTSDRTVEVVRKLLEVSPIVTGSVDTSGPRHCPSIDRKVLNFPDKKDHQIFLELESSDSKEIYLNGLTTAMPPFAQEKVIRSIKGLERAEIMRYGYAVEYDYAPAYQLYPTLESKKISGLFFAGQINGTSGYEEAASQGFLAGVNAARKLDNKAGITIDRSEGYIGVLVDDLIHKETPEPYRVLPSRAEYRLTLRFDNAFMRLLPKAKEIGILSEKRIKILEDAIEIIAKTVEELREVKVPMQNANELLSNLGEENLLTKGVRASDLLQFKCVNYGDLERVIPLIRYEDFIENQIETIIKYETFIEREKKQIERFKKLEDMKFPDNFNFDEIVGLSNIAKSGINDVKPLSIGEASRISGVTGQDIAILIRTIKKEG